MTRMKRRTFLQASAAQAGATAIGASVPYVFSRNIAKAAEDDTIKVGILHSLSGTIAIIETSLHNAELLAIEEITTRRLRQQLRGERQTSPLQSRHLRPPALFGQRHPSFNMLAT